jgi:hypothetical protein
MGIEAESRTTAMAPIEFGTDRWRARISARLILLASPDGWT